MNVIIRNVCLEDLDAVTKVESICFPKEEAATRESLEKRIKTFPEVFFVAEVNNEIIGFINGCITNESTIYDELYSQSKLHIPNGNYQTIFGLDVIPDFRRQGIAEQLMNHIIQTAKCSGRKGLILTCKPNLIAYYEKFGYINKGISNSVHGGTTWHDMILNF
ncbi:MAG: GNAT family N-acetyltransferase [Clostridium sp.]